MPQWFIATVFGLLALAAVWGIYRSLSSGVANDGIYRFDVDKNPLGFALVIASRTLIIAFAVAVILHALGLIGDPVSMLRSLFG
ncbi:hypothetical protein LB577_00570 [Mesorhizobium sp. B283B1A]|uniref:hypothetical protein n=1 Tax=Mesorhizobium TaxID=68287 RepID=UPI00112D3040|nr:MULTISPECIES: hypothetical protein [Mesorhizobium]MCA0045455.1 hypothetical protein [Mesorhizobium sp. B283B1A]TPN54134.1 hypothetical protein FJ978_08555 [Mesorhizobium sp. B1-1-7]UQS63530.1 hypothetical protein M5D98_25915 [Mesorhizobium opportunistum]